MRKVLSIVLTLAMILGSFSMAFAANITPGTVPSDVKGTNYEEAVTVLTNLGVITGYPDGSYKPDGIVNRAEATLIVIKALGMEGSVGSQKSSYTDLSGYSSWAEGYIAFATQLGIVNGYGDGTFRPGQTVSYNEFATMLVRALGYTDVSLTGTWPAKYVNRAAAVGIMDDVKSGGSAGANRGDIAIMANNALTAPIGLVNNDNNWNAIIKSGSETNGDAVYDTMIGRLGGYFYKGIITDGMDSQINIRPYIGKYAEYYTDEEKGKGDILTISKVKSQQIHGNYEDGIKLSEIAKNGKTFEGSDDVDYKIGSSVNPDDEWVKGITFFRNGEVVSETDLSSGLTSQSAIKDIITDLHVELSGKTVKTLYSVMAWKENSALQVAEGDLNDIKENQSLLGYDFDTDKNDAIIADSFELIGVDSLDGIKVDHILYVYNAEDDDVIRRVAVGTEVVEGKISKVKEGTTDADDEWTIDGKVYTFANTSGADTGDAGEAGDTVKVYLDAYGEIYKVDSVSGSAKDYAIIKNIDDRNEQIRMYLADDSTKTYDYDLDNKDIKALSNYWNKGLTGGGVLVGYSFDRDNVVDSIYPNDGAKSADKTETLDINKATTVTALSNRVLEYTVAGSTAKQVTIDNNVVVFTIDDEDDLDVSKIEDLDKEDDTKNLKAGNKRFEALVRDGDVVAILVHDDYVTGSSSEDYYAVISEANSATNNAGDKAQALVGWVNGRTLKDTYTAGKKTVDADITTVAAFELKYNDDKDISKASQLTANVITTVSAAGDNISLNKGYIRTAQGTLALAKDYHAYEVVLKNGVVDEYKHFTGTMKEGYTVWAYDADTDNAGYEVIIFQNTK